MGISRVANATSQRKGMVGVARRQWLARAGMTLTLSVGLGLVALAPESAPAVAAGLAHVAPIVAPIVAHARSFDGCPGGLVTC